MIWLTASAAFGVGFLHSILSPAHWLPVVLMTKSKRWGPARAAVGALIAASGHILLSVILAAVGIRIGHEILSSYEEQIEHYAGLGLVVFGVVYAGLAYFKHIGCHGHSHHAHHGPGGAQVKKAPAPYLFLFSLGFSPCIAALPVFVAASGQGRLSIVLAMAGFALGVISALVGATLLATLGLAKLDHPVLDHHGDTLTGVAVALLGLFFFFFGH
jgi:nickel/cobalt exporter